MDRITVMNHVCGIFNNGIAFVIAIGIWIILPLSFLLYESLIIFEKTVSHFNTLGINDHECTYYNDSNVSIPISNFYKIGGAASIVEVFLIVIYFIMQLIDRLSLNIILLIEFCANIVVFAELILHLIVRFSISVNYCYTPVVNETLNIEHYLLWHDFLFVLDENVININILFPLISRNESIIDANKNETVNMKYGAIDYFTYDKVILDDASYDLSIGGYEYYSGYREDITFESKTFTYSESGGEIDHKLTKRAMPIHNHNNGKYQYILHLTGHGTSDGQDSTSDESEVEHAAAMQSADGDGAHNNLRSCYVLYACVKSEDDANFTSVSTFQNCKLTTDTNIDTIEADIDTIEDQLRHW